ncbi:hypothetical protein [Halovivax gelatinilyticus]|uniref:hypothetical protein n=1 Tax=Halovivax gelatinilyticus TaxID=2961597 RepID=UPI0020CA74D5|nr:hypothetical protein [Halovivax gelatinilyticus]
MTSKSDEVRVWLVDRGYTDRDLIVLRYATPDGDRVYRREVASQAIGTVTAARGVSPDDLASVDEPETRERYADEAARMAERHAPDDSV